MARFGDLLAELRQDRKMTQRDLAEILYVTDGTISNYENGVHLPDIDKLVELADYFNVTTDYLLGRCTSQLSPDVLDELVLDDRTAGKLIRDIQSMSLERRQALSIILNDMQLSTLVGQYSEGKK